MRKMKNFLKTTTLLMVTALVMITMNYCSKTKDGLNENNTTQDYQDLLKKSKEMEEHILAFKTKMEYYRDNPSLKSGGDKYNAPDAVLELESLINFTFCYTNIECNKKVFITSNISMPLDELEEINDPKLMEVYYDKVIDTIQAQMIRTNYENMKLLLVDLEQIGTDSNGDAIVSVGALIGNEGAVTQTDEEGYWFGGLLGNCQQDSITQGNFDATTVLQNDLYFVHFPTPPPGKIRKKTSILFLEPAINPWNNYIDPINERDNYLDSKVFSATINNGLINDDTRCLSDSTEMPFYRNHYNQFINEADSINEEYEFTDITINWYSEVDEFPPYEQTKIWHELDIWLGRVWLVNTNDWPIGDITTY